jgi:hypothetical protein
MFIILSYILCCIVSLVIYKSVVTKRLVKLIIINFFLVYVIFLLGVYSQEFYLEYKLNSFDLDGDGFFTENEITPEQAQYMSLVVGDVGRTFAPITGLLFSIVYSIFYLVIIKFYQLFKRKRMTY